MNRLKSGLLALCLLVLCGCSAASSPTPTHRGTLPSPKPSHTLAPTPEPTPVPTLKPTPEPTPEPTLEATQEPAPTQTPAPTEAPARTWVLNTNTMKIHYPSCSSVSRIAAHNYAESTASLDELLARGYSRCGRCF